MKLLLLPLPLLAVLALAANENAQVGKVTKVDPNLTCKTYEKTRNDCNYCVCTKCTDGKNQWDQGECACTTSVCPINKDFWAK